MSVTAEACEVDWKHVVAPLAENTLNLSQSFNEMISSLKILL